MKLQQLRYVVKVAECGSITEASRRLFVSQPSITASIRDLENEMGVHIFERTNKGVIVSEEGETFLGYARRYSTRPTCSRASTRAHPSRCRTLV